jgi:hypothetical protein
MVNSCFPPLPSIRHHYFSRDEERKRMMGLRSILTTLLKGKVVAAVLVGTTVVGGATVAMASPAGQTLTHQVAVVAKTVTTTAHKGNMDKGTATPDATPHGKGQENDHSQQCASLPGVQRLATKFALSTASQSDDVQAICSLHDGTFKGTTTSGSTVSAGRVYGLGEIDQLLTYAQFLASHDKGNADSKLTSSNARTYLADALAGCGKTPLEVCLKANTSATPTPTANNGNANKNGKGNTNGNGNDNGNGNGNDNGNGKAKSASTPTLKH